MQRIIGFVLLLCVMFSLYIWTFEPDMVVVSSAGPAVSKDAYGNDVDVNGFVVPEYNDDKLSGNFYDAASKPLGFINDVASAFDNMRVGIVSVISSSTKITETITNTLSGIFNFDDVDSWWADVWYSFEENDKKDPYRGGR